MDPILVSIGPLALRWYGFLIALGVLVGSLWAVRLAPRRGVDPDKLLDAAPLLVIAGIVGARLVYVLTSPSAYFGPGGDPFDAVKIWQGGGSIHGGLLGIVVALWFYARARGENMWAMLDVMAPIGALGIVGGRLGNFMNGSDTTGRVTDWAIGFTPPPRGADTLGAFGRFLFGDDLWAFFPQVCSLGTGVPLSQCLAAGGELVRGPVHPTQLYGVVVGLLLIPIVVWALRASKAPGFVFWQFVLWYSVLRSVLEEPFRDNPLFWNVLLREGPGEPGIGLFTLTQLVSLPIVLIAAYMLFTMGEGNGEVKRERLQRRARGR